MLRPRTTARKQSPTAENYRVKIMLKTFKLELALSCQDSFKIISESGGEVANWQLIDANPETGRIEWKQSFWTGYGVATIKVELAELENTSTLATVSIHRPMQIWDPAKICERVFKKLERKIAEKSAILN